MMMAQTPKYVAKKVEDRYELVRADPAHLGAQYIRVGCGAILLLHGVLRRGIPGGASVIAGLGLVYRGFTGQSLLDLILNPASLASAPGASELAPSYPHEAGGKSPQLPKDQVEEASMESFPASDAPTHTGATPS